VKSGSGFTLIEIMLVVIIIGVLAAMVIPNMSGRGKQARISAAKADIGANLMTVLDLYELDNGQYPTTEQGLSALIRKPNSPAVPDNWDGPYLKKKSVPVDPWGKEYVYVCPGARNTDGFDLYSLGPDGIESEDDIVNWVDENS